MPWLDELVRHMADFLGFKPKLDKGHYLKLFWLLKFECFVMVINSLINKYNEDYKVTKYFYNFSILVILGMMHIIWYITTIPFWNPIQRQRMWFFNFKTTFRDQPFDKKEIRLSFHSLNFRVQCPSTLKTAEVSKRVIVKYLHIGAMEPTTTPINCIVMVGHHL